MKILTVTIPCYNSADYMEKCIESLLPGGEDIEILIVDDGSDKDNTAEIADRYQEKYPDIVRAIHQPNGGHGEAVNTGIREAKGLYFKVVDSDDHVDPDVLRRIISFLKNDVLRYPLHYNEPEEKFVQTAEANLDLLVSNFMYDKAGKKRKKIMEYTDSLPVNTYFTWDDVGKFKAGHYILMHSVIYRTKLLRDCGMVLPKHTFYVDNIYVFEPMPYVKRGYYLNECLYYYFIGREDQSVNQDNMIKRLDQQARVNKIMVDYFTDPATKEQLKDIPQCEDYMFKYLLIITTITSVMAMCANTPDKLAIKKDVWDYIEDRDKKLYKELKHTAFGLASTTRGRATRDLTMLAYKMVDKLYHFN